MLAPLVPPEVDLRDFAYMPLDVARLRDSDIAARATGEEFRTAVLLWCASWHQLPAGSLPDDDLVLAQLSGFGRAVSEWLKVREGAMHNWIKCSDGRWYHPHVAKKANEAWAQKLEYARKKQVERDRKSALRGKIDEQKPAKAAQNGDCPPEELDFPPDKGESPAEFQRNSLLREKEQNRERVLTHSQGAGADFSFDRLWKGYPRGGAPYSRPKAKAAFDYLGADEQRKAILGLSKLIAYYRQKVGLTPPSPETYLAERRFDIYFEDGKGDAVPEKVALQQHTPQFDAWDGYLRRTTGKGPPVVDGKWYFDAEWPPAIDKMDVMQ